MSNPQNVTDTPKKTRTQPVIGKTSSYKSINALLINTANGGKSRQNPTQFIGYSSKINQKYADLLEQIKPEEERQREEKQGEESSPMASSKKKLNESHFKVLSKKANEVEEKQQNNKKVTFIIKKKRKTQNGTQQDRLTDQAPSEKEDEEPVKETKKHLKRAASYDSQLPIITTPKIRKPKSKVAASTDFTSLKKLENKSLLGVAKSKKEEPAPMGTSKPEELQVETRQFQSDYFVNDLKRAHNRRRRGAASQFEEAFYSYFVSTHDVLKSMRKDYITDHARKLDHKRKHPRRKLLVLDLDETLIHCSGDLSLSHKFDRVVNFINNEGEAIQGLLNTRPYAQEFLRSMSQHYELVVLTASLKYYADQILSIIDPNQYITAVYYRESCSRTSGGMLVKDLKIFHPTPLEEIILVDNNPYCLWPQFENGIPILSFYDNKKDGELKKLEKLLVDLKREEDHRALLKAHFRLHTIASTESVDEIFNSVL